MAKSASLKSEHAHYEPVKNWLDKILREKFSSHHLEVTADGKFSNSLLAQIDRHRDLIFSFLGKKGASPDITGFLITEKNGYSSKEFIIAEVKNAPINLDDIYQTRKYAELFDARYALLVSTEEIPEKIIRLPKIVHSLLSFPPYQKIRLVSFKDGGLNVTWFEEDPFVRIAARAAEPPSS